MTEDPPAYEVDPDIGPDDAAVGSHPLVLLAIATGGAVGTLARYGLGRGLPTRPQYGFSAATFVANLGGAFLLGLLLALVVRRWPTSSYLRPALGTGVLGGFTTFSTLQVEVVQRFDHGHAALAVTYLVATLVLGLLLAVAGLAAGSRWPGR